MLPECVIRGDRRRCDEGKYSFTEIYSYNPGIYVCGYRMCCSEIGSRKFTSGNRQFFIDIIM